MRMGGSSRVIVGVPTRLKKYSRPIQRMPKMKCSQRSTNISVAMAFSGKAKWGAHEQDDATRTAIHMRRSPRRRSMADAKATLRSTLTDAGLPRQSHYTYARECDTIKDRAVPCERARRIERVLAR